MFPKLTLESNINKLLCSQTNRILIYYFQMNYFRDVSNKTYSQVKLSRIISKKNSD